MWSKIIAREPNSYKAHSSLGILLIKRGQEQEGISEMRKSLSINPSYPDAHNNMGTLYEQKACMMMRQKNIVVPCVLILTCQRRTIILATHT